MIVAHRLLSNLTDICGSPPFAGRQSRRLVSSNTSDSSCPIFSLIKRNAASRLLGTHKTIITLATLNSRRHPSPSMRSTCSCVCRGTKKCSSYVRFYFNSPPRNLWHGPPWAQRPLLRESLLDRNGDRAIGELSRRNELRNAFMDRFRWLEPLQEKILQSGQNFCCSSPSELL